MFFTLLFVLHSFIWVRSRATSASKVRLGAESLEIERKRERKRQRERERAREFALTVKSSLTNDETRRILVDA